MTDSTNLPAADAAPHPGGGFAVTLAGGEEVGCPTPGLHFEAGERGTYLLDLYATGASGDYRLTWTVRNAADLNHDPEIKLRKKFWTALDDSPFIMLGLKGVRAMGISAGAMNAAVFADGFLKGRRQGAIPPTIRSAARPASRRALAVPPVLSSSTLRAARARAKQWKGA